MDYTTLKNNVFEKYFFNSYLPGTLGAYESSTIFNYLLSLESIQENLTSEMNVSERWIDNIPTWYTNQLTNMFFIPRFTGETDQDYLDRLFLLINIGQDDNTIITATYSVIKKALLGISQITITEQLDGVSGIWDDTTNTKKWNDPSVLWGSSDEIQRTLFVVDVKFFDRGSLLDITTWDYWDESINYTKIEDMVNLYKPPGSTFELRLVVPEKWTLKEEIFSNTFICPDSERQPGCNFMNIPSTVDIYNPDWEA